jgi:DNA-binding Lrp family transcriptional regulator
MRMTESGRAILDVLETGLILTPVVIAENTDYSRKTVIRRLRKFEAEGRVVRQKAWKYQYAPAARDGDAE